MNARNQNNLDYYEVLQISRKATPAEVKEAFHKLALNHHPNKGGDGELFKQIHEAYAVLGDSDKKNYYDESYARANQINLFLNHTHNDFSEMMDESQSSFRNEMENQSSGFKIEETVPFWFRPNLKNQVIFYVAGELISIKENTQKSLFPLTGQFQFRELISPEEIKQAFPVEGMVKLFLKKHEAIQYSRATQLAILIVMNLVYSRLFSL